MIVLSWLLAFTFAVGIDLVYSRWIFALTERRRASACFYSACVTLLGFLSVLVCLYHYSAVLWAALGHSLGTWIAIGGGKGKDVTRISS